MMGSFKIKIVKILLIAFFINLYTLESQTTSNEAIELLDKVSQRINYLKNLSFEFTYVLENSLEGIRQETNGKATLSKNLYKISFLGIEQVFDGSKIYTIIPENEEVNIEDPEDIESSLINVSNIFEFYKKGYIVEIDIKQKVNSELIQYVKLIPEDENSDLKYILIGIKTIKLEIYKIIEIGIEKTQTTLTILNQIENKELPENFFTFNKQAYSDFYINED